MAKPLSPVQLARLKSVTEFVMGELRTSQAAETIIAKLEVLHGATRSVSGGAYTLRAGGVVGSCTWSRDEGLLASWRKNATVRLMLQ